MFLSNISIRRPVLATMMNLSIMVFGLFSLPRLAIEQYPNIDFPVVSVWIAYPGADPQSVEEQIIDPMEKAVNGINGLDKVSSTSFAGAGLMVLRFVLEKNSDEAAQDVRDKVFGALDQLPTDVRTPVIQKFDFGGVPILEVSLSSKTLSIGELSQLSHDKITPRLQRVDGVARVDALGERLREVHVLMERNRLSSYGISAGDVFNSIRSQAIDIPAGKIETETGYMPVRVSTKLRSAADVETLPVLAPGGLSGRGSMNLQIKDVAQVTDTVAFEETASYYNENSTILFSVFKQSGGNTTTVSDGVSEVVERLRKELPQGVELNIVTDNSRFIRGSIDGVKLDLLIGAILAVFTVLIFLRNGRATLISAVALPTAVIGTFAFFQFMHFTLNMMSTLGLSLSIGILIDDAIVVIENIYRHLHMGKTPKEAAKEATAEIGLAVLATTMTICAVFVPVAFMEGIIGRFFYQFGLTVAFAVLISLFVAFTLTPMLSSRYLKKEDEDAHKKGISGKLEKIFVSTENIYRRILSACLKRSKTTVAVGFATFIVSIVLLKFVPMSFFPRDDRSQFTVNMKLQENTPLAVTKSEALTLSKRLRGYPGVKSVVTSVATGSDKSPNTADLTVLLVPIGERGFSQDQLTERIRDDLSKDYTKPKYELTVGGGGGGGGGRSQNLQFVLLSTQPEELDRFSQQVADFIRDKLEGAVDVQTTKAKPRRELTLLPRLTQAIDLGVTPSLAATQARSMFEGDKVGKIEDGTGRFDIRVRLVDQDRRSQQDVESVTFKSQKGREVPLMSAMKVQENLAPSSIERYNGQRQITVLANYTKKDLGDAVEKVQKFIKANAPPSVTMSLEGEAEIMKDSIAAMMQALLLAVLLIYMILCVQYERYLAPFVIMMALPLSFTGAFGALLLTGQFISIYTMIGLILLMGLVTKNGILLIDFTLQRMEEGLSTHDALMEAGPIRLRPILMTTFAASFGMLPLAIGHGEGGEAKASMGIAVIGGLIASTLLTLVVVPCLFNLVERLRTRFKGGGRFSPVGLLKRLRNRTRGPDRSRV